MKLFTNVVLLQVFFCLFILMYLFVLNQNAREVIPIIHIGSVLGIFMLYNIAIVHLFLKILDSPWTLRFIYLLSYAVLFFTLSPVVSFLVHDLYPRFGIQLFDADVPFDENRFQIRLIRGFTAINIIAAFIVFVVKVIQYVQIKRVSEQNWTNKLNNYQFRIEKNEWKSHFLRNIFSVSFGRRLIDDKPKKQTEIFDIIQFLDYQLQVPSSLIDWDQELDQLHCFIRLIRYQYGEKSVLLDQQLVGTIGQQVPHAVLLFPLENVLKHGDYSEKEPILYQLKYRSFGVQVVCTNKIATESAHLLDKRLGTGLKMLKTQAEFASFPIDYQTISEAGYFTLMINFNYTGDEEGNL